MGLQFEPKNPLPAEEDEPAPWEAKTDLSPGVESKLTHLSDGVYEYAKLIKFPEGVSLTDEQALTLHKNIESLMGLAMKSVLEGIPLTVKVSTKDITVVETVKPEHQQEPATTVYPVGKVVHHEPMCNIGFSAGQTIGLPNFSNIKIGVSINIPCFATELDETFDYAKEWVDKRMQDLQDQTK